MKTIVGALCGVVIGVIGTILLGPTLTGTKEDATKSDSTTVTETPKPDTAQKADTAGSVSLPVK